MHSKIFFLTLIIPGILTGPVTPNRNYVELEEDEKRLDYILVEKGEGIYELEDLTKANLEARATQSDITYYFYSQSSEDGQSVAEITSELLETFDPEKEILLTIHGWQNDYNSTFNRLIRSTVLEQFDINVIVADWGSIAKKNYFTAKNAIPEIGRYVGQFMDSLVTSYNISLSNISIVGHSLGAHVAGVVGSALKSQVDYIIGLDPAAPLISVANKNNSLDMSDARFVQVIHTNGGILGLLTSIGHTDYFPNGGTRQPGCGIDITGSCAHGRSYEYYAESIRNNNFFSKQCPSYHDFTRGACEGGYSLMGGFDVDKSNSGDFYLVTNKESPYAEGELGSL